MFQRDHKDSGSRRYIENDLAEKQGQEVVPHGLQITPIQLDLVS